ncbi:GNAT family N-acetyltransferase [Marivirga sp. S37H4]|uniref:GNAT family N-acetyltransferase n=1 Tax=Marivirga aurantiaca TaxID=2802615 RepID=A0A934WVS2_9BACT|nr:GNAT family N-acetyltransferase [Marivirga aurantiaca]MBK6263958.1 GNAT family N-acetyltransferase [Marivirga aurantiaca]
MEIKRLNQNETKDFINLIEIFKEVFENDFQTPDPQHLSALLSNPNFIVFVVRMNDKVIGGLTVYVLPQYYNIKPLAYIYDVGIAPDFQGKGMGKALIKEVCSFCKANGFDEAYVEAESDDIEAVNFYRKTDFTNEMNAIHFTYSFTDKI